MVSPFEPLFLDAATGQCFAIHHPPQGGTLRGIVVYVHPFAEEMNKSRRMAALGSRALAAQGFAVLQIDLLGCGDSSGDFGDATWADWLSNVLMAVDWMRARHGRHEAPLWLWGLRAGCLLASAAAARLVDRSHLLLWQPTTQGAAVLQQFLRLQAAADLAGGGKGVVEGLKQSLADGQTVQVAGYALQPALALPLAQATLARPPGVDRVVWLETSTRPEPALLPASSGVIDAWRAEGADLCALAVTGPAFWQTAEIEEALALVDSTVALMVGPR